jgi:hypothetical protein
MGGQGIIDCKFGKLRSRDGTGSGSTWPRLGVRRPVAALVGYDSIQDDLVFEFLLE